MMDNWERLGLGADQFEHWLASNLAQVVAAALGLVFAVAYVMAQ